MNYKTYAEAKIANPDSEIVTTNKRWSGCDDVVGYFEKRMRAHQLSDDGWVVCNPADYCSSLKDFFDAGFRLASGDKIIGVDKSVWNIAEHSEFNHPDEDDDEDVNRYILSASALDGGCKIPAKAEQWTIYSNTLPLCELTDEQKSVIFNSWVKGGARQLCNGSKFVDIFIGDCNWHTGVVYRIKPKSERELFIDKSLELMTSETERTMEQMFGAQFDAGARYKDLTQHFGENI